MMFLWWFHKDFIKSFHDISLLPNFFPHSFPLEAWALYNFGRLCLMRIRRQIREEVPLLRASLAKLDAEEHFEVQSNA